MRIKVADDEFIIDHGVAILEKINAGINTITLLANDNKEISRTTVFAYVDRLKDLGLIVEMVGVEKKNALKALDNDAKKGTSKPLKLSPSGLEIVELFKDKTDHKPNNRIMEILERTKPDAQELAKERIWSMTDKILANIEASRDVSALLRKLLISMTELNNNGSYAWSEEVKLNRSNKRTGIKQALELTLNQTKNDADMALVIGMVAQWARASRYTNSIKYGEDTLFAIISEIASDNEGNAGRAALLTLAEFRDREGRITKNVFDAILTAIWESYHREEADSIANSEADFDVIKAIYPNLTPEQKIQVQRIDKYVDAANEKEFLESVSKGSQLKNEVKEINEGRRGRLGAVLAQIY